MAENARINESATLARRKLGADVAPTLVRALIVAPAVLALLLLAYGTTVLSSLPAYPGTVFAFLIIVVVPGIPLQAVLLRGSTLGPVERLVIALPLGLSVAVIPGLIVLERHTDLQAFSVIHTILATVLAGVSMLFWRSTSQDEAEHERGGPGRFLVGAMLLVALGGIVTAPLWAKGRVSADYDDWTYLAYANDYVTSHDINASEPFLGTSDPVNPRMRSNVWVLVEAQVAKASDVPVSDVVLEYARPLLAALILLATFAFTKALFKNVGIALLAACFHAGYALTDLSAHEGMGRNILIRSTEDKMVAAFLVLPVALIFLLRYLETRSWRAYLGFSAVVLGLAFIHPVPLVFLAVVVVALGLMRLVQERSLTCLREFSLLLIPVGLASVWPFVQRQLLVDVAPELFGTDASSITFRDQFRTVEIGAGLLVGNYHMIIHPLMLLAIVLVPVVWYLRRTSTGGQLALALTVGALVVFFCPLLATPVADVLTPQTLWKMPWMIPVGPILAAAVYEGVRRSPKLLDILPVRVLAPGVLLVAILALGLAAVDQYGNWDGGAFYDWRSEEQVLPTADQSVFLGGLDRTFANTWLVPQTERELLSWLQDEAFANSVVLAEPAWINHVIPGVLNDIYPVDFGGQAGEGDRRDGTEAFDNGDMSVSEFEAFLDRYGVDFVVARETGPARDLFRDSNRIHFREEFSPYVVYDVR